jgi:hypothetical protein
MEEVNRILRYLKMTPNRGPSIQEKWQ